MSAPALVQEFLAPQREKQREQRSVSERRRIPLSIVPAVAPQKRGRLAVILGLILAAALGAVLVLNITVSNGQYDLVKLRGQETILTQQNEALRQQAEYLQAPQNLAAAAAKLGMVAPGTTATIDLSQGKVFGTTTAAESETKVGQLVSVPENPVTAEVGTIDPAEAAPADAAAPEKETATDEATAEMPVPSQAEAGSAEAGTADAATADSLTNTATAEEATADSATADSASDAKASRPDFDKQSLNGGSIPAPTVTEP
ncbi:cell division protein FtsB [Neomicrococcus aestuarii]|uniref:Cell division protein FtsB n=1 Tax=Neomicrococcus aestuarii TaxID=556325 RepID=A0A7W8TXF0_9MICC|nr:hypothetical protein [Neomicrococcus aestuarii]MBB5513748.1 cell division protein FtsB [Neomicrococcus aestuarii]